VFEFLPSSSLPVADPTAGLKKFAFILPQAWVMMVKLCELVHGHA